MKNLNHATLRALYIARNNAGVGYSPYEVQRAADTVDAVIDAAREDGWEVSHRATSTSDITILECFDGEIMGIGDSNGPWAVILVP